MIHVRNIVVATENVNEQGKMNKLGTRLKQTICLIILKASDRGLVLAVRTVLYIVRALQGTARIHDILFHI